MSPSRLIAQRRFLPAIAAFVLSIVSGLNPAATSHAAAPQTPDADRVAWFREARYGMFIHWGVYSVPAGIYRGEKVERGYRPGNLNPLGEWIMHAAKIPVAEYAEYAKKFNPVKFDADAWVRLAKDAGMKYIVITTKHHDGFAMFKSAASSFNIVDATPFRRDPIKELAAACKRHGIRLGFYYSQAQDWHHAGGAAYPGKGPHSGGDPKLGHWDPAQDGSFDDYLDKIAIPQVRELLTNYGPISIFWWDTPVGMTLERAARLAEVLKLQPKIVTNNRLFDPRKTGPYEGDTMTPEQNIPATGFGDRLFEVCMTMNETWGYKSYDHNWKSAPDIVRKLIDIASKGGNFLLNVGPTSEGEIPAPSVERLREAGDWVRTHGEAIYGTTASRFRRLPWGRSTTKGNTLYFFVFDWPADGRLVVPGLKSAPRRAILLPAGTPIETHIHNSDTIVALPSAPVHSVASALRLDFDAPPEIAQVLPTPNADGVIVLPATLAAVVNAYGSNARLIGAGAAAHIGEWNRANTTLNWEYAAPRPATLVLEAEVALAAPSTVRFTSGKTKGTARLQATGGLDSFRTVTLGTIIVENAGECTLDIQSTAPDWNEVRLRTVRLRPLNR